MMDLCIVQIIHVVTNFYSKIWVFLELSIQRDHCFFYKKKKQQWGLTKVQKWQHSAKLQESFLVISLIFVHFTLNKHVLSMFDIS